MDEVDASGDVAPLVAAAELQPAATVAVEVIKVVRLDQLVHELGKAEAFRRREAALDAVAVQHGRDASVAADVGGKVEHAHRLVKLGIVDARERWRIVGGEAIVPARIADAAVN